ncbi:acyltransferase family protein [Cysteiniphilum sp. JM-1]|uniref:acyltransferase family protein n=1 Tax=Cysteiniphilum sp. JM-1 TaxID=2610891 RepID=UPI00168D0F4A|nr:acyltransferase family protein [Cysteiniphilum sp. JM-1]
MSAIATNKRLDYLDNLKWVLIFMVIAHHTCIAFGGPGGGGYYWVPASSKLSKEVFLVYLTFQQSFFMTLFFAISSYFLLPALLKKGNKVFLIDRLKRLGIPLLFMVLVFVPIMNLWREYLYAEPLHFSINLLDVDQLWFVRTLLIFTVFFLIYHRVFAAKKDVQHSVDRPLTHKRILSFIILLTVVQIVAMYTIPMIMSPHTLGIVMPFFSASGLPDMMIYIFFFGLGIKAWKENWLASLTVKIALPWFAGAVVVFVAAVIFHVFGYDHVATVIINVVGRPLICSGICLFLIVLFKTCFNKHSWLTKNLALAAYTAYILQRPFITAATLIVAKLHLGSITSFFIAAVIAIVSTFFVSHFIRQLPVLRKIL